MRLVIMICWMCVSILSQAQQNPFELSDRLPASERTEEPSNDKVDLEESEEGSFTLQDGDAFVDTTSNGLTFIQRDFFSGERNREVYLYWFLPMLIILLALVINIDRNSMAKFMKSVTNLNYLNLMYRDQRNRYKIQYLLFAVIFVLSFALFIKQSVAYFWSIDLSILHACGFVAVVYLLRHVMMHVIHFAFPGNSEIVQFAYTIFIFNIVLGVGLLLLNFFIAFSPSPLAKIALYIGVAFVLVMYIYRLIRGVLLSSNVILRNKFRFFMYICTLEIAPIFLIISIFRQF